MLTRPDEKTKAALLRLMRGNADFMEVLVWLEYSVNELDRIKRTTTDSVLLRQQQGAAQAIAEVVDTARGKTKAIAATPRQHPQAG